MVELFSGKCAYAKDSIFISNQRYAPRKLKFEIMQKCGCLSAIPKLKVTGKFIEKGV